MARASKFIMGAILSLACIAGLAGGGAFAADEGGMNASVTVLKDVDFITVTPESKTVTVGSAPVQFNATANYTNAEADDITTTANWTSSNTDVAVVDDGQAIILATGTTTLTAELSGKTDTATLSVTSGSAGGGGGGGGGGSSGTTSLTEYITGEGRFVVNASAESVNGKVKIFIPKDTVAKNRNGGRLNFISIKEASAPEPPDGNTFVCLNYDIGPSGSSFYPPVYLTFIYDQSTLPPGVEEENLVIVYSQDGKWIEVGGDVIDPAKNTITVLINHLTIYTVMAHTTPASFEVNGITISPAAVYPGDPFTISATITNNGALTGNFNAILKINNVETRTKTVTIGGNKSETVSFTLTLSNSGEYTVDINGLTSRLTVNERESGGIAEAPEPAEPADFVVSGLSITPVEIRPGGEVTVSATVYNVGGSDGRYVAVLKIDGKEKARKEITLDAGKSERISFILVENMIGNYTIGINGQTGQFTVKLAPPPPITQTTPAEKPAMNWRPMTIIFGVIIILVVVLVIFYRKLR